MEIERQHIMVKKGSKIVCLNECGENIIATLEKDICCWPEGVDTLLVMPIEVIDEERK
jgi:hypothetical protein